MPVHKPSLAHLSATQLAELSGHTVRTVSKRLGAAGLKPAAEDGKTRWYVARNALRAIFDAPDPLGERKRLDGARADLAELDLRVKRGELVPASDQDELLISLATATSARLQSVPAKIAQEVAAESDPAACETIVRREIHLALNDLAEAGRAAGRVNSDG